MTSRSHFGSRSVGILGAARFILPSILRAPKTVCAFRIPHCHVTDSSAGPKWSVLQDEAVQVRAPGNVCERHPVPFRPWIHGDKPLPDLRCRKLCKELISTGQCNLPGCTYAHRREELRAAVSRAESFRLQASGASKSQKTKRSKAYQKEVLALRSQASSKIFATLMPPPGLDPWEDSAAAFGATYAAAASEASNMDQLTMNWLQFMAAASSDAEATAPSQEPAAGLAKSFVARAFSADSPAYVPLSSSRTATPPSTFSRHGSVASSDDLLEAPCAVVAEELAASVLDEPESLGFASQFSRSSTEACDYGLGAKSDSPMLGLENWGNWNIWGNDGAWGTPFLQNGLGQALPSGNVYIDQQAGWNLTTSTNFETKRPSLKSVRTSESTLCSLGEDLSV
ncbi:unnamed protein product [Polarella glacialis]|uniref:C3H1-type domain-containing protein n=1 Tax=Polarella glacialis TaxID=89957 RepID=A0A813GF84_POLGL|nr:unnamed protein product [Polarella glacialis]CAE8625826.1 unnamed protein product [Polarella glacialis]